MAKMSGWFRGRQPRESNMKDRHYTWDIECAGLNPSDPLLICVVPFEKFTTRTPESWVFRTKEDFREWLDSLPSGFNHILFAHNGSRFDNYSVFDAEGMRDAEKFERDGRVFWVRLHKNIEFRDSYNLLPVSLASLGAKGVTPRKFIDKTNPEYGRPECITQEDIDYCIQDCVVLKKALQDLQGLYGEWVGLDSASLPLTTAGMAHRIWTHMSWPDDWRWIRGSGSNAGQSEVSSTISRAGDEFARSAFYGGRVQILGTAGERVSNAIGFDCNSLYPYMMVEHPLPHPKYLKRTRHHFEEVRESGFLYWGDFTLVGEEGCLKFLPGLNDEGRRDYSLSNFSGWLCSPELEFALENGWRLEEVGLVYYATKTMRPFSEYVDFIYQQRMVWKSAGDSRQQFAKILLNSLFGLFATRGLPERIESISEIKKIMENEKWRDDYDIKWWSATDDVCYLEGKEAGEPPEYTYPIWASFITSHARIHLANTIKSVEVAGYEVHYCDTDCCYFTGWDGVEPLPFEVGPELGQWLPEGEMADIIWWEPKVYTSFESTTGKILKIKHKGCNLSTGDCRLPQKSQSVRQYRQALRTGQAAGVEHITTKRSRRWCVEGR